MYSVKVLLSELLELLLLHQALLFHELHEGENSDLGRVLAGTTICTPVFVWPYVVDHWLEFTTVCLFDKLVTDVPSNDLLLDVLNHLSLLLELLLHPFLRDVLFLPDIRLLCQVVHVGDRLVELTVLSPIHIDLVFDEIHHVALLII